MATGTVKWFNSEVSSTPLDRTSVNRPENSSQQGAAGREHGALGDRRRHSRADRERASHIASGGLHLTRRGWTIVWSMVIVLVFGLVGTFVRVPYVALGPGPTHDTLAETEDGPLIAISGSKTYETSGELRLTTVAVQDGVTLLGALGLWASGSYALAPRELYFPPGETDEEVKQKNAQQFVDSQDAAVSAALAYLKESGAAVGKRIRYTVVVQEVTREEAARVLDPGDELVEVNGRKVSTPQDVLDALKGTKPNEKITVTFREADAEAGEKAGGEVPAGAAPAKTRANRTRAEVPTKPNGGLAKQTPTRTPRTAQRTRRKPARRRQNAPGPRRSPSAKPTTVDRKVSSAWWSARARSYPACPSTSSWPTSVGRPRARCSRWPSWTA